MEKLLIEQKVKIIIGIAKTVLNDKCRDCGLLNEIRKACAGCETDTQRQTVDDIKDSFDRLFNRKG